jgi:ubiquinol-cytochrome c reductase cytochrome b subunit
MSGLMQINPIWMFGPYDPAEVTAGSQPDWYMGWLEGGLRIMPNWETHIAGFTISWNVFIPGLALMGLLITVLAVYPFVEKWVTGDDSEHHLLDRPRNAPTRTGFGAAGVTFYGLLWAAGGNDILATHFHLSLNSITWFMRFAVFIGPVIAFIVARRWCISLQRHDRDLVLHGHETGVIIRSPDGGYSELHAPVTIEEAYLLTNHPRRLPLPLPETVDSNGVRSPESRKERFRAKLSSFWYADDIPKPTVTEIEASSHHHGEPAIEEGHHVGIETGGQVGGDDFELEEEEQSPVVD